MESMMTGTASRNAIPTHEIVEFCTAKLYAVMGELASAYAAAKAMGVNQEVIGARLGKKKKGQISRILNAPKNITVWTLGAIALAMDSDLEIKITPFAEKSLVNFKHETPRDEVPTTTDGASAKVEIEEFPPTPKSPRANSVELALAD